VALLLYTLEPHGGDPYEAGLTVWITAASLTVGTIAGLAFLGRRRHGATKSMLYGVATGATSGLIAVLTSAVLTAAAGGVSGVFHHLVDLPADRRRPSPVPAAAERHAGPPSGGLPTRHHAGQPAGRSRVGSGIFGEDVRTGYWLIGAAAGIALIAAGVVLLSRSSLLQQMQLHPV
jgi:hypothetical protein